MRLVPRIASWRGLGAAAFLPATMAISAAPLTKSAATESPQTHVLFLGADIELEGNREPHRVEDVTASQVLIRENGRSVGVPLWKATNLRISEKLKLTAGTVRVEKLSYERAYTDGADPMLQLAQSISLAAGDAATRDLAQANEGSAQMGMAGPAQALAAAAGSPLEAQARADYNAAQAQLTAAQNSLAQANSHASGNLADVGARAASETGGAFDAIRFSFEVTVDRDLQQPYYALIAQIREAGSQPGKVRKWTYLKSMERLKAGETGKVTVLQGGFPAGYMLERCDVHIYDRGEELATNLARKRVPLTTAEAVEYEVLEHIGTNKNRTLPAELASVAVAGGRFALAKNQLDQTSYARVASSGEVIAVFQDKEARKPLEDEALEKTIRGLRFKPALQAGKPVESIAAINLGGLKPR